jgi:ferritin
MSNFLKTFESFSGIEKRSRLSTQITSLLNNQIRNELESSQLYRSMASFLDDKGWIGASKYFWKSADEELVHMNKIYEYLYSMNCKAVTPGTSEVKQEWKSVRDVIEESLDHEIQVTNQWSDIANAAIDSGDDDTYSLAQWYLHEQIEEETKFRDILFKMNLDMPKWEVDKLFEELTKQS